MTRLLQFIVLASMLVSATLVGTGIDFGAPDCHTHGTKHQEHEPYPDGAHDDVLQLKAACDCSCPCCTYVAHLIPLPASAVVFATTTAPETLYAGLQASWCSLAIAPPIRPPKA